MLTPLGFRDQFRDDGMCARVVIEVVGALKVNYKGSRGVLRCVQHSEATSLQRLHRLGSVD